MALGLVVERWLFFAEAEHVSMLYYGPTRRECFLSPLAGSGQGEGRPQTVR